MNSVVLISRIAVCLAGLFLIYLAMDKTADTSKRRVNGFLGGLLITGTIAQWGLGSLLYKSKNSLGNGITFFIILATCLLITIIAAKIGRSNQEKEEAK